MTVLDTLTFAVSGPCFEECSATMARIIIGTRGLLAASVSAVWSHLKCMYSLFGAPLMSIPFKAAPHKCQSAITRTAVDNNVNTRH